MIKLLIKLISKVNKTNELTKDQFLYKLSYQEQNEYCIIHNISFKQAINNLKQELIKLNKINKNITVFSNDNIDIIFYKGNRAALVNKKDKEIYIDEINLNR